MKNNKGFTLIELLLVVVIIGLMLAVIVPRAWRANVDTKYGLVRQNATELASFGNEWMEQQLLIQSSKAYATKGNYAETLCSGVYDVGGAEWVASVTNANWVNNVAVAGASIDPATPEGNRTPLANVLSLVAPAKHPRNPFNGASVFVAANDPTNVTQPVPGAIALGAIADGSGPNAKVYYAFCFAGTDSTGSSPLDPNSFYAGQATTTMPGLRNGVFFNRLSH